MQVKASEHVEVGQWTVCQSKGTVILLDTELL